MKENENGGGTVSKTVPPHPFKYVVIVAGGSGTRIGGDLPKQFLLIDGIPMLWWSVRAFHAEDPSSSIIIVMHPGFFDDWDILWKSLPEEDRRIPYKLVCGGRTRLESVRNGIMQIPSDREVLVAVHDAARPGVPVEMISRGWACAGANGTAVPVLPVIDSLRRLEGDENISVNRADYVRVQTPQIFQASMLKEAYDKPLAPGLTDDASVVEMAGGHISLYKGDERALKVTVPVDVLIISELMK